MSINIILTTPFSGKIIEPLYDKPNFIRPSIVTLAGFLRKDPDFKIKCIDAKFEQKNLKILLDEMLFFKPDIIGISAFTYEIDLANELAENIKKLLPECLVVIGGSHVSAIPIQTLQEFKSFDIGTVGESEITLKEICYSVLNSTDLHSIKGIVYRNNTGEIVLNPKREKIENLDIIPIPAWDMFPAAKDYFIQTSRGCPHNCNFCFNSNGNKIRSRSVTEIIEEIEWLIANKHPHRIIFGDEAFAANGEFADDLLDEMINRNIGKLVNWEIQTHAALLTEHLLSKMKMANINKIEIGVESGNEAILKKMGKGVSKKIICDAFKLTKKYRIKTGAFLIFGHPDETKKSIHETIKFAVKINPTEPIFAIMVPFPGTKIAQYVKENKHGYVNNQVIWSGYRKQINNAIRLKSISLRKLKYYLISGNLLVFVFNFRFWGLIKFLYQNRSSAFSFLKKYYN